MKPWAILAIAAAAVAAWTALRRQPPAQAASDVPYSPPPSADGMNVTDPGFPGGPLAFDQYGMPLKSAGFELVPTSDVA